MNPSVNDLYWSQLLEETKWLQFVRLILAASWQVAFHVLFNRLPVLVHCSHGWDRTSQVTCIAQILLDPFYRTRKGFSCLIEKDFLSFGHPFHTRCGHGEGRAERGSVGNTSGYDTGPGVSDEAQISPIFIQFLDCVFQLVNQCPNDFEFNTIYLLVLSDHVYSCRFGTLLCDTEKERETVASIRKRTFCLWEYVNSDMSLLNPSYELRATDSLVREVMNEYEAALMIPLPSLLRNVVLWSARHCMHGPKASDTKRWPPST
jgi:myotubularin-related protein 1/2